MTRRFAQPVLSAGDGLLWYGQPYEIVKVTAAARHSDTVYSLTRVPTPVLGRDKIPLEITERVLYATIDHGYAWLIELARGVL